MSYVNIDTYDLKYYTPTITELLKIVGIFPVFFTYLFFETQDLPVSLDVLVKLPFVLILFLVILFNTKQYFPVFFILGVFFALKQLLIIPNVPSYYLKALKMAGLDLVTPVLAFFMLKFLSYLQIQKVVFYLAILLVLATIPYHFGLENPLAEITGNDSLMAYGSEGLIFSGPFANIHNASITLSFCLFTLLYFFPFSVGQLNRFLLLVLIFICFIGIYLTYVRTAYVMLFFAVIFYSFLGKNLYGMIKGVGMVGIFILLLFLLYANSEILQMRFSEKNIYDTSALSIGSGRLAFWSAMFDMLLQSDIVTFLMGIGRESSMDYMKLMTGKRIFAHNTFIDILVSAGALGLILFLAFLAYLYKRVFTTHNFHLRSYRMVLIIFSTSLVAMIFQSHYFFWCFFFISGFVAMLEKEYVASRIFEINQMQISNDKSHMS